MPLYNPAAAAAAAGAAYANECQWRFNHSAVNGIGIGTPSGGPSVLTTFSDNSYGIMTSAASGGATAGIEGGGGQQMGFEPRQTGRLTLWMRTGADITNVRYWMGMYGSGDAAPNSDTSGSHFAGFRYSSVAPDAGWVGVTRAAAGQTVSSTIAPIAADTAYKLEITFTATQFSFAVNSGSPQINTLTLPTMTLENYVRFYIVASGASARSWYFSRMKLEYGVLL